MSALSSAMGNLRGLFLVGAVMLVALSGWLWHIQPAPQACTTLLLTTNRLNNLHAAWSDGSATWPLLNDAFFVQQDAAWVLVEHQATLWKVRPDGSHARPLSPDRPTERDLLSHWLSTDASPLVWVAPDGQQQIAVSDNGPNDLRLVYRATSATEPVRLRRLDTLPTAVLWRPDSHGVVVVAATNAPTHADLTYVDTVSMQQTPLIANFSRYSLWRWVTPTQLLVRYQHNADDHLYLMQVYPSRIDANGLPMLWLPSSRILTDPTQRWLAYEPIDAAWVAYTTRTDGPTAPLYRLHLLTDETQYLGTFPAPLHGLFDLPCLQQYMVWSDDDLIFLGPDQPAHRYRFETMRWIAAAPPHDWQPLGLLIAGVGLGVALVWMRWPSPSS